MKFTTTLMALAFTFTASAQTLIFFNCIGVSTVLPAFGGCCASFTSAGVGVDCKSSSLLFASRLTSKLKEESTNYRIPGALAGTTGSDPEYYCNPTSLQDEPACCHYPSVTVRSPYGTMNEKLSCWWCTTTGRGCSWSHLQSIWSCPYLEK